MSLDLVLIRPSRFSVGHKEVQGLLQEVMGEAYVTESVSRLV